MVVGDDPRLRRMAVLDAVMNNTDRKGGHILPVDGGRHVHGVDHGVCFSPVPKLRTVLWGWRGEPFAPDEIEGLERIHDALDGDLGADAPRAALPDRGAGDGPADGRAPGRRAASRSRRRPGRRCPGRRSESRVTTAAGGRRGTARRRRADARPAPRRTICPEVAMRRWNGWGDDVGRGATCRRRAMTLLQELVGPATPPVDASLDAVVAAVPAVPPRPATPAVDLDPEARIRARPRPEPARLDRPAARPARRGAGRRRAPGRIRPPSRRCWRPPRERRLDAHPVRRRDERRRRRDVRPSDRPVVTVDLAGAAGLLRLDETSGLATFGAGTYGPGARGGARSRTASRSATTRSRSRARRSAAGSPPARSASSRTATAGSSELFAGGHLETPRGPLDLPPYPASAAGPDLRQVVLGSEGRLGILTEVTVRASRTPAARAVQRLRRPRLGSRTRARPAARPVRPAAVDGPRLDAARDGHDASRSPATVAAAACCAATSAGAARAPTAAWSSSG